MKKINKWREERYRLKDTVNSYFTQAEKSSLEKELLGNSIMPINIANTYRIIKDRFVQSIGEEIKSNSQLSEDDKIRFICGFSNLLSSQHLRYYDKYKDDEEFNKIMLMIFSEHINSENMFESKRYLLEDFYVLGFANELNRYFNAHLFDKSLSNLIMGSCREKSYDITMGLSYSNLQVLRDDNRISFMKFLPRMAHKLKSFLRERNISYSEVVNLESEIKSHPAHNVEGDFYTGKNGYDVNGVCLNTFIGDFTAPLIRIIFREDDTEFVEV